MANDNSSNTGSMSSTGSTTGNKVGEAVGGVGGAATGAAIGSIVGPIGTIIGGIAGAATGWWTGRAVSDAVGSFGDDDTYYKTQYETGSTRRPGSQSSLSYDHVRPAYQLGQLAGMNPDYQNRKFEDVEGDLQRGWNAQPAGSRAEWSDVRDYAREAYGRGTQRLVLSEEQLAVGKRQVQAGEVNLRKTVETHHVEEQVGLVHEEVELERRPLNAADSRGIEIGEQTIRVPLMAEEAVVEKRVVGTEEVVVRKHAVTENQTVEADVRKERLVTEGLDKATTRSTDTDSTRKSK